jgi:putative heme-binding domain-containing protein
LKHAPNDAALARVISDGIQPEMPGAWQLHPTEVKSVAAYVRTLGAMPAETLSGDAGRGQAVYQRSGCANCHVVAGAGTGFGPELTAIGTRRSGAFLRQTVSDPAQTIPENFEYIAITPVRGTAVRGIRMNEDSFTIQIHEPGGRFHSYRKSEIKELKRLEHETPMPAYGKQLNSADLDDLVAYLAGLRGQS